MKKYKNFKYANQQQKIKKTLKKFVHQQNLCPAYLISTALRDLHVLPISANPKSETSEPETSRVSHELSTREIITSSFSNSLLRAIAAIDCYNFRKQIKNTHQMTSFLLTVYNYSIIDWNNPSLIREEGSTTYKSS